LKIIHEKSIKVVKAADRISIIIRGLRAFSRQADKDPFKAASVSGIIQDTLSFCREKMRHEGVELVVDVSADVEIECRSVQISQVLLNLLNNANDAVRDLESRQIRISTFEAEESAVIQVEDTGSGVPENITTRIFEPFFTTKEVGQGTGLGLSIAKGIVDEHHGEIYVDKNHRSRFTIRLPKRQTASSA
jgi:C4-dicarboxylate-specific signal transduction histidine kinase